MESFSWSDSLRALTEPCLACLRSSKSERNDLEDLLVDSGSATTADAETLSLHSNPGALALAQRRRRSRFGKSIRLFGWDLFGRRQPIRLPDDDDEEEEAEDAEGHRGEQRQEARKKKRKSRRSPPPTISSSTLDSDAAPLDSAAIVSHATKHAEEEEARAARRAQRRERKERERAALALALEHAAVLDGEGEFEGFPGSGAAAAAPSPPPTVCDGVDDARTPQLRHIPYDDDDEEDLEEEGDFGAGVYARRTPGSSDSGRGSDSRSRTSTSVSATGPQAYNHHFISQQPSARPVAQALAPAPPPPPARRTTKNKSSRSSSSSKRSRSSLSASQSPSLQSPVAPQFPDTIASPPGPALFPSPVPRTAQELGGFPNGPGVLQTVGIERLSAGFPSPGLGGPRNGKRDMGAFLANRGDV